MVWAVSLLTMKLIPHRLTPWLTIPAFGVWLSLVTLERPRTHPVLYPPDETPKTAPKCISGRTSYLRVRLAFHRYPQLIRAVFNRHRSGPSAAVRPPAPWPWVDHSVSGRRSSTECPVQTCFRCGCAPEALNLANDRHSPVHSAKGTPSDEPEGYRPPTACKQPVSGSVSLPSRGAFHLSLTVLVHYRWPRVFSLRRWSSGIHPGLHVSRITRVAKRSPLTLTYRAVTVSGGPFQSLQLTNGFLTPCAV